MAGPSPHNRNDDLPPSRPSTSQSPQYPPRQASIRRAKAPTLNNAGPPVLPPVASLHRSTSTQNLQSPQAARPSVSPSSVSRQGSISHTARPPIPVRTNTGVDSNATARMVAPNAGASSTYNGFSVATPTSSVASSASTLVNVNPSTVQPRPQYRPHEHVAPPSNLADGTVLHVQTSGSNKVAIGEFAQRHLFAQFEYQANAKIEEYINPRYDSVEIHIDKSFGPRADPQFDQLLQAIGHSASRNPKSFLDKVTVWHDRVIEPATTHENASNHNTGLHRDAQHERRASLAIYLLCRALLEILRQTTYNPLKPQELRRVEELVYERRFRALCREGFERSAVGHAKWDLLTQVIGVLFEIDSPDMSNKILQDLGEFQHVLGAKGTRDAHDAAVEAEAVSYLKGLRTLKLRYDSDTAWNQSRSFLDRLSKLFDNVHGQPAKEAYCRFLGAILLPVAGSSKTDFLELSWKKLVSPLSDRLGQLASKPKYWQAAAPTQAILACISPYELFVTRFHSFVGALPAKLRERSNRATAIKAICRLTWAYFRRTKDSREQVTETLSNVVKTVFFSGRKYSLSREPAIAEPLVQLIRIIGYRYQELCFRSIIFPLLNADQLSSTPAKDLRIEHLDADKSVIGIRACLAVFSDIESSTSPPFPLRFDDESQDLRSAFVEPRLRDPTSVHFNKMPTGSGQPIEPISTEMFSDLSRSFFGRFSELVIKIVQVCDAGFGGQASIDDRMAASSVPKTPLAGGFNRKDDSLTHAEERGTFLDLLLVGICAIPRCASNRFALQVATSCICNSTVHTNHNIGFASALALKSIAQQGHAQLVIAHFLGFVLNYDHRCAAGSPLGMHSGLIESTLRLYMDLLKTWVTQLNDKTSKTSNISPLTHRKPEHQTAHFDMGNTNSQIDRVESQALFFFCSGSPRVRSIAKEILKLVVRLDESRSQNRLRMATLLEAPAQGIVSPDEELLSVYEKSVLMRNAQDGESNSIFSLCCISIGEDDKNLWYRVLPRMLDMLQRNCPIAVAQTRDDVCIRLNQMQPLMESLDDRFRTHQQSGSIDTAISRHSRQPSLGPLDTIITQWKAYLIFACKTLLKTTTPLHDTVQETSHTRKSSKSSQSTQDSFSTSWELFQKVLPFLSASHPDLREAAVSGLGSISVDLLRPLLECIGELEAWYGEMRRQGSSHYRATSSPRRQLSAYFSTENAHVLKLVSHFLLEKEILRDAWVCQYFQKYVETLSRWLHEVGEDAPTQLSIHFCGIVENVWRVARAGGKHPSKLMEPWTRLSAYTLMERWTGLFEDTSIAGSQSHSPGGYLPQSPTMNRGAIIKENLALNLAAMASMAVLCDGPLKSGPSNAHSVSFDIERLMVWIDEMFKKKSDTINAIGKRALTNVILQSQDERRPADTALDNFYKATTARCLKSYLEVTLITLDHLIALVGRPMLLTALLYTLANSDGNIRTLSARLLRALDENRVRESVKEGDNEARPCNVQEYDMSISDRTAAVYKKANFDLTLKLSRAFSKQSDVVFAQFSKNFQLLKANTEGQRSFVHAILPWLTEFELNISESGELTAQSYMMLMNLMEITFTFNSPLQHEIQALWQALVSHNKGNISIILTFTMDLTLEKKNPSLVEVARQIIVFMSTTRNGEQLRTALLQQIVPSKMQSDDRQTGPKMQALRESARKYAHVGEIPLGDTDPQHPWDMTAGQLSLILLVDLIVAPQAKNLPKESIPSILQAVLVLWDHKIPIVKRQAREMLVHLIHELVIARYTAEVPVPQEIEAFVDLLRRRDSSVSWEYAENERADKGFELSRQFQFVIKELRRTFATIHPSIDEAWGQATLHWALNCRVLHLALRSLQVYRCIVKPLNQKTVADLVRVLASLVADDEPEKQSFAIEAMRTIRAVLHEVDPTDAPVFRLLFWTVGAWLGVGKEAEFEEGLIMLDIILSKFDLNDEATCRSLIDSMPPKLQWAPGELTNLILRGCRSSKQLDHTLKILLRLIQAPSNELIGGQERLLYVTLANLPRFVQLSTDSTHQTNNALEAANTLANVAAQMGISRLANELEQLSTTRSALDTLSARMTAALGAAFFPEHEYHSLVFVMGLLTNKTPGMQKATLVVLDSLTEHVNMSNPQISSAGPDLVSPLLRLLQTDLCPLALKVLDKFSAIMSNTTSIPSQLHMSMADHRSTPMVRKLYDGTQSLFGIPEETGWSVPMPAQLKASTRDNLAAVANMHTGSSLEATAALPTPEVEFYREDAAPDSYFPVRGNTMTLDEVNLAEANMGELASKLDNLDDFFGDDDADADTIAESGPLARSPSDLTPTTSFGSQQTAQTSFSSGTHRYQNSLTTNHIRSYQSSTSNARLPSSPRQPVMSPSAFNPISTPPTARPSMPSRSITSPPVPQPTPPDKTFLVTHHEVEPFSDDDILAGGTASDASSVFDGPHRMPRSRSIREGLHNVKKRLTSGKHSAIRGHNQQEDSPDVPKLPDVYRHGPSHGPSHGSKAPSRDPP